MKSMYGHPALTRYPHLKPGPTDAKYTKWQKVFAWRPIKTLSEQRVWLKYVYRRERTIDWTPPQFPEGSFDRIEYETIEKGATVLSAAQIRPLRMP